MNQSPEKALVYLTGTENIDAVTVDDLQKLVAENPYFPVTQFLLAKKLKDRNEPGYSLQVQKATLYFSNPYWLQYQLTEPVLVQAPGTYATGEIIDDHQPEENSFQIQSPDSGESHPVTTDFSASELIAASDLANETVQEVPETETIDSTENVVNSSSTNYPAHTAEDATAPPEIIQEEETTVITNDTNEKAEGFIARPDTTAITAPDTDKVIPQDMPPSAEKEVVELEEEMAGVTHDTDITTTHFLKDLTPQDNNHEPSHDDEHDKMFQNIKAMLDASSEEADADTKNAVVPIDPYYTIDYFASQGIKLELDPNPEDQLGQHLKKFTHWLRHMKKLGPEDATEVISRTETEADIQQIADSSNTVREVVTEAMASVLEKQGKKEKAIELYNKLSFLNPGKSAYFADKIKKLKGI